MATLNLHATLSGKSNSSSFLKNISISEEDSKILRTARTAIRTHLREQFKLIGKLLDPNQIYSNSYLAENRDVRLRERMPVLEPKFYTQGSFQYKTLNSPAVNPPQEIDLDDGVYIPMPFYNGEPAVQTSAYFAFVESALADLCKVHNWRLTRKSTCVRIYLTNGKSHIDLPLYAVSQEKFDKVTHQFKSFQEKQGQNISFIDFANNAASGVDSTEMKLATTDIASGHHGWINSDPKELNDWFERAIEDYGNQVRRVCRYIKAWRDQQWNECNLSSIAIMTLVVEAYSQEFAKTGRPASNRDDIALLSTIKFVERKIGHKIENPVLSSQNLAHKWSQTDIDTYRTAAATLAKTIDLAINNCADPAGAITQLQQVLGPRIPIDASLIVLENDLKATILSTAAVKQPQPEVTEIRSA